MIIIKVAFRFMLQISHVDCSFQVSFKSRKYFVMLLCYLRRIQDLFKVLNKHLILIVGLLSAPKINYRLIILRCIPRFL